jgi:hypothetical protein
MAATYTPIASTTLGADASSVIFSSIPSTYTDLVLIAFVRSTRAATGDTFRIRFNSDTASNYSTTFVYGDGPAAGSSRLTSQTGVYNRINAASVASGTFSPTIIHIMNYSNSTTYKTTISRANSTSEEISLNASLWRNTSAITSITALVDNGNLLSGSTLNLYGILGANA